MYKYNNGNLWWMMRVMKPRVLEVLRILAKRSVTCECSARIARSSQLAGAVNGIPKTNDSVASAAFLCTSSPHPLPPAELLRNCTADVVVNVSRNARHGCLRARRTPRWRILFFLPPLFFLLFARATSNRDCSSPRERGRGTKRKRAHARRLD